MGPILIVDDEFGLAESLRDLLRDEGYRVTVAFSGRQALELMAEELPALVLLDYMMPSMNGPELLEVMKKDARLGGVSVVMMSAAPPSFWKSLPCAAFLPKPFTLMQMLEVVHQFVGAPREP
ncbi:response regulator [Melittangium boletus]|uniref:Two-component system response regulator n=1 Tax=Melittangium boletus DSM 14713 TaxID=1294270 RepID=A0A250ITJ3_9BACT|nr:response regulator [Melittangium boletus]ATB34562.1 two-component system response regulator [Melittangium boletus DSM 14713]